MKGWMIAAVVVVCLIVWIVSVYNGLVKLQILVDEAFATMDVYLKKRYDMIPNLVEVVKGYAVHEKETLEKIVRLRSGNYEEMSNEEKWQADKALSKVVPQIMALAENYPELKANQNFMGLSQELSNMEEEIASARKYYNGAVKQYNMKVQMFPGSLIAGLMHFTSKTMYQIEDGAERQNVQVKF